LKPDIRRQVAIGVVGTLVSLLAGGLFLAFFLESLTPWITMPTLALLVGAVFGFLFFIFGGWSGFRSGAGIGAGFVAALSVFQIAMRDLPSAWLGVLFVTGAVLVFGLPLVREYRRDRRGRDRQGRGRRQAGESAGRPAGWLGGRERRQAEKEAKEEEAARLLQAQVDEWKAAIGFGERSLLLMAPTGGFYQLVRAADGLRFIRVGGELAGLDPDRFLPMVPPDAPDAQGTQDAPDAPDAQGTQDAPDAPDAKQDFRIPYADLDRILVRHGPVRNQVHDNSGHVTFRTGSKTRRFLLLDTISPRAAEGFFARLPLEIRTRRQDAAASEPELRRTEADDPRLLPRLKAAVLAMTLAAILVAALFVFLPLFDLRDPLPAYRVLSALCILLPLASLGLYIRYDGRIVLGDQDDRDGTRDATFMARQVGIQLPFLLPGLALGFRTLRDFTLLDWLPLLAWSAALLAILLALVLAWTTEYRRHWSVLVLFLFVALFFVPSALVQVNCLYDKAEGQRIETTILEKREPDGDSWRGSALSVRLPDGTELELEVSRSFFDRHAPGDPVTVRVRPGFLGLRHAVIPEGETD